MNLKSFLTILTIVPTISSFAHAEMKSELFTGYNGLGFERNDNDFIGTDEAAQLKTTNLGGYLIKDINDDLSISVLGKYVNFDTSDFTGTEDDTPSETLEIEASVMKTLANDSLMSFSGFYADANTTQDSANASKTMQGYNVSFVNDFNKITYMITLGKQTDGSVEAQDTVRNGDYAGLALSREMNDKLDIGFSYNTFVGKEYDETVIKTEQTSQVSSLFAQYKLSKGYLQAGYKIYENERKDVEGSGYGTSEEADGDAYFLTYSLPFGNVASKKERMLMMHKPDIVEFSTIGGSVGD